MKKEMIGKFFRFVSLLFVVILLIVSAVSCGASWQDTADGGKEKIERYADGTVKRHIIKDGNGNEITKSYNQDGSLVSYLEDHYDENGTRVFSSYYCLEAFDIGGEKLSFWTHFERYAFDENGTVIGENLTYYTQEGKKDRTEDFTLAKVEGSSSYYHLNSRTLYNPDETIREYQEYDSNDKIIRITRYNTDGSYSIEDAAGVITNYDKDGNIIE